MKYAFIIITIFLGFGCNEKPWRSNNNEYDISVLNGSQAYIYLKQRVDSTRLNSIADSCFHHYVRDMKDTFKVSFLYWADGKDRSTFAEKVWAYDHINNKYHEYPLKKVALLPGPKEIKR